MMMMKAARNIGGGIFDGFGGVGQGERNGQQQDDHR